MVRMRQQDRAECLGERPGIYLRGKLRGLGSTGAYDPDALLASQPVVHQGQVCLAARRASGIGVVRL